MASKKGPSKRLGYRYETTSDPRSSKYAMQSFDWGTYQITARKTKQPREPQTWPYKTAKQVTVKRRPK